MADPFVETHNRRTCSPACIEHEIDWRLERVAFLEVEEPRRRKADRAIAFYNRGLYTFDELLLRLREIAALYPSRPVGES